MLINSIVIFEHKEIIVGSILLSTLFHDFYIAWFYRNQFLTHLLLVIAFNIYNMCHFEKKWFYGLQIKIKRLDLGRRTSLENKPNVVEPLDKFWKAFTCQLNTVAKRKKSVKSSLIYLSFRGSCPIYNLNFLGNLLSISIGNI